MRAFHHKVAVKAGKKTKYIEFFTCENCKTVVPRKEKQIDHIDPVVNPATGFTTWDNYIDRLWVEADKLMVLCLVCHSKKSVDENARRKRFK